MATHLHISLGRIVAVLVMAAMLIVPTHVIAAPALTVSIPPPPAGSNLWLTGHDLDYHCASQHRGCHGFKIAVDFVRNGSSLPLLILDSCPFVCEVTAALQNAYNSLPPFTLLRPATQFAGWPLLNPNGSAKYSAIIVASDATCGGCDNGLADIAAINARKADIAQAANKGTGILALSGAANRATYYDFLPTTATAVAVNPPFTYNALGLSLGLIEGSSVSSDDNCCPTHNSFSLPSKLSQFKVIETDSIGNAETLIATGVGVTGGGTGLSGLTAMVHVHATCVEPPTNPNVICGSPIPGCHASGGSDCMQSISVVGVCIKSAFSVVSGTIGLGTSMGSLKISGLHSCSVTPFPIPISNTGCIASRSFCYGALINISGTGLLSGGSGTEKVSFSLSIVDDDTGVASNDSNTVNLTIQTPTGPYVTGWHCSPPNGMEFSDCGIEVTGHG